MQISFLEASVPLTKQFAKDSKGVITKTPYPMTWEFTSIDEQCSNITQLEPLLIKHATANRCVLKGNLAKPLVKESRAGSTNTNDTTEWLVLDFDGIPELVHGNPMASIEALMQQLDMDDISYIVQWSASMGIENSNIRAHVFVVLDKPYAAPLIKQWLVQQNHTVAVLKANLTLTRTGNSLSWPLDISACQNDKLIYIAPPVLKNIKDPLAKIPRIKLVKKARNTFALSAQVHATAINKDLTQKKVEELRAAAGLPKKKTTTKMHGSIEVMMKPDTCTITEMRQERGFVYFNLNGGDSWAYYHPENNPDFIFNFKGEPTYLTKELLPDYYSQLASTGMRVSSQGIAYLAFCDTKTSAYYIGKYDQANDDLQLSIAKNSKQVVDYAKQVGLPIGDFIPYWDLTFDPHDNVRVDFQNKTVNTFTPSIYMKATPKLSTSVPKTILKVITHALGGDQDVITHFLNWLSFIVQERDRTGTAWVLHGVPGTGKGILCNNILRPLFSMRHTAARRMEELNEQYNHYMRDSFLVVVDEVQTKALVNERGVMAKLKNFITEMFVPIRMMYSAGAEARNYTNWIFNSNMSDPVLIESNDRRFNVAKYQPNPIVISPKEVEQIERELQAFYDYLVSYKMDRVKATTILHTADRDTMISISQSSIDTVSSALLEGKFEFFMDQLPAGVYNAMDFASRDRLENYKAVLKALMNRTDAKTSKCSISREELRVMYDFVIGGMPNTPNKFTSLLKHHRIHIEKVWMDNKTVSGIKVSWLDASQFPAFLDMLDPAKVAPVVKAALSAHKAISKAAAKA